MSHSVVTYQRVLVATVRKDEAPALVADAVRDAALAYAKNAGAKNTLTAIASACTTTATGKARTPNPGTSAALILASVQRILNEAQTLGAWPAKKGEAEKDPKAREALATGFADTVRADFVTARTQAEETRRAAMDAAKALKGKKDQTTENTESPNVVTNAGRAQSDDELNDTDTPDVVLKKAHKALSTVAGLSDAELSALAHAHPELSERVAAIMGASVALRGLMIVKPAQVVAPSSKKARGQSTQTQGEAIAA